MPGRRNAPRLLVQSYGVYWQKDQVAWNTARKPSGGGVIKRGLWGRRTRKQRTPKVNFWPQVGIYILYNSAFEPIYSGQGKIGSRLHSHFHNPWMGRKWVYFSWFGLKRLNIAGTDLLKSKKHYGATAEVVLDTLEAVLIAVGARTENKQGPRLHSATRFFQVEAPERGPLRRRRRRTSR